MLKPRPRIIPQISEIRDVFKLGPCVEPLDQPGVPDFYDSASGKFAYRFFRDCEVAPFIQTTDQFVASNAWILSDASWLAYTDACIEPDTTASSERAAGVVTERVTPSISRLFESLWSRDGRTAGTTMKLRTFVRVCPVAGVPDPVQCFVADDGNVGIVAFRGTVPTSLANWLTDCEIAMVDADTPASGALVHEGFSSAAHVLLEDFGELPGLRRYLAERLADSPGLQLWFTGHSFGAALATLAAYRLGHVHSLYTYGSPRVGNTHFANAFSKMAINHYRVVHRHDIVPRIPLSLPLLEYEHVGDLKYFDDDGAAPSERAPGGIESSPSTVLPTTPASFAVDMWEHLRELAGHLRVERVSAWLDPITDHAAVYYSNRLWNEFVRQLGLRGSGSTAIP